MFFQISLKNLSLMWKKEDPSPFSYRPFITKSPKINGFRSTNTTVIKGCKINFCYIYNLKSFFHFLPSQHLLVQIQL